MNASPGASVLQIVVLSVLAVFTLTACIGSIVLMLEQDRGRPETRSPVRLKGSPGSSSVNGDWRRRPEHSQSTTHQGVR